MNEILDDKFIANLKILRGTRGFTQGELSVAIGFKHYKRIADIEGGRVTAKLEEVKTICKFFNVAIDDMINKKVVCSIAFE